MTFVERENLLAKSEVEIAVANVATLVISASRMVSGEVVPNFEAIVAQNEMSFAQKRKDVSTVRALLSDEDAVVPALQKAAEMIRSMRALSEAIIFDTIASIQMPSKPLPEGSLLRDTLRRLHYVQKVVESVTKWINDIGEHDLLKSSVLFTKTQQELIRTFKRVVIQVQQATVIIGKYRDMGDIRVLREMTIDAQSVLIELREADENLSEKRKSISLFKRAVEESKAAPKIVRLIGFVMVGFAVVVALSFAVIKLNALSPQVFSISESMSKSTNASPAEQEVQLPSARAQGKISEAQTPTKSESSAKLKESASPINNEATVAKTSVQGREDATLGAMKLAPLNTSKPKQVVEKSTAFSPSASATKKPQARAALSKASAATKPIVTNVGELDDKVKSSLTPVLKKATNKPVEKTAKKTIERKSASPKVLRENEVPSQKSSERPAPKRKTIVIED